MKKIFLYLFLLIGIAQAQTLRFTQIEKTSPVGATSVVVTNTAGVLTYTPTFPVSKWTNDAGYLTSSSASVYVPYSGATGSVNLGANSFSTSGTSTIGSLKIDALGVYNLGNSIDNSSVYFGKGIGVNYSSGIENAIFGNNTATIGLTGGNSNCFFGASTARSFTAGYNNNVFGSDAMVLNPNGNDNIAIGTQALLTFTRSYNIGIGTQALRSATSGSYNLGVGYQSLYSTSTSTANTGIGHTALYNVTTGNRNTALGYNTGLGITTGSANTIIGANVTGLSSSLSNNIILADGTGSIKYQFDGTRNVFTNSVNIGNGTWGTSLLHVARFATGTGTVDIGEASAGAPAIWMQQNTPTSSNYVLQQDADATQLAINSPGSFLTFRTSGANRMRLESSSHFWSNVPFRIGSSGAPSATLHVAGTMSVSSTATLPGVYSASITGTDGNLFFYQTEQTSGAKTPFRFITPANTAQTASTECIALSIGMNNIGHSGGNYSFQREVVIGARTHTYSSASVIAEANGLEISPPVAGTNATFTSNYALKLNGSAKATGTNNLLGPASANTTAYGGTRLSQGSSWLDFGDIAGAWAIWGSQTSPTTTNYALTGTSANTYVNAATTLLLRINNNTIFNVVGGSSYHTTPMAINKASAPVASAAVEIESTTKGFLPPRMKATQGSAISSPAEGLIIYVTDTNGTFTSKGWWGYSGAAWEKLNN